MILHWQVLSAKKLAVQDRVDRFNACSFKFVAYIALSVYGYDCLKDEAWFPRALGGTAPDIADTLVGWSVAASRSTHIDCNLILRAY